MNTMQEVFNEFGANKYCVFTYYNKEYTICLLICFFPENIYAIIGEHDIKYIELDDLTNVVIIYLKTCYLIGILRANFNN